MVHRHRPPARALLQRLEAGRGVPDRAARGHAATMRIGKRIRRTSRSTQDRQGELNQILQETLSGHMVVKAFGAEEYESRRFRDAAARLLRNNARYILQQ